MDIQHIFEDEKPHAAPVGKLSSIILIECLDFELVRRKYISCDNYSLTKIFDKASEPDIIAYLKEIGFYDKFW